MRADVYADAVATRIEGPLLFLKRTVNVGLNEAVEVIDAQGSARLGRVAALNHETLTVEVLESTSGLDLDNTRVRFRGEPLTFGVGLDLLGRVFDGVGRTIDGGPPVAARERRRIDGRSINPAARTVPTDFIETGVTTIDLMNSLVRGQKLPIFSGAGLPHDLLAIQIALQARLRLFETALREAQRACEAVRDAADTDPEAPETGLPGIEGRAGGDAPDAPPRG